MEVHEAANLFPMLNDDDLGELVEDIRANGLHEPVWLYDDPKRGTVLLDGRNRMRACEIADVKPTTRKYTGTDPVGFVLSLNLTRRHLTREQRTALAVELGKMGRTTRQIAKEVGISQSTASRAVRESNDSPPAESNDSGQAARRFSRLVAQITRLDPSIVAGELDNDGIKLLSQLTQWAEKARANLL